MFRLRGLSAREDIPAMSWRRAQPSDLSSKMDALFTWATDINPALEFTRRVRGPLDQNL